MESLGDLLKTTREEKGYTFDYISRETNISSRYLEALEKEDFSIFPGEPYILGFLKTYGSYLELNANEVLSLYRSHKIQEQTIPMEQLLRGPSPLPKILGISGIVLAAAGIIFAAIWFFALRTPADSSADTPFVRVPVEYTLAADSLERRFYIGDTILVSIESNVFKLELSSLGDAVNITTPQGVKILDLGQEAVMDFTGRGLPELKMIVTDFSRTDVNAGALLRFELETFSSPAPDADLATRVTGLQGATLIFGPHASAYPFTLQAAFQGYCLFRWEILTGTGIGGIPIFQNRSEQYFQRSDERSITVQNGMRIGVSNAQAVRATIIGDGRTVPIELGGAGEVIVADIRWIRDEDNRYRLVLIHLE